MNLITVTSVAEIIAALAVVVSLIFVVPSDGGTPRRLTTGAFDHNGPLAWSPDGSSIVFSANRDPDYGYHSQESDLWRIDVATAALSRLTERVGPDFAPTFSPDGTRIAYLGYDDVKTSYENAGVLSDRRRRR